MHTFLDKLAVALSGSARRNLTGAIAIANARYFEINGAGATTSFLEKLAAHPMSLVMVKVIDDSAFASEIYSDRLQYALMLRR